MTGLRKWKNEDINNGNEVDGERSLFLAACIRSFGFSSIKLEISIKHLSRMPNRQVDIQTQRAGKKSGLELHIWDPAA